MAALASAVVPGCGQLLAGARARGAALLSAVLLLAAGTGALVASMVSGEGWAGALAWVLEPGVLARLLAVNLLLALLRALVVVDAWRTARRALRPGRCSLAGLLAVLVLLVALPHAALVLAGLPVQRALSAVFAPPGPSAPAAAAVSAPATPGGPPRDVTSGSGAASAPRWSEDAGTGGGGGAGRSGAVGLPGRLTVLLLGSDAAPGRTGTRIDAIVVASLEPATGEAVLVSLARNLADVPLTGMFAERLGARFPQRLMSLYTAASQDDVLAAGFPDPGTAAHVNAAEALLAVDIDHVARVDLAGFVEVIDALGGVELDLRAPLRVRLSPPAAGEGWRAYDIPAGRRRLDGHEAHAYVRSRTGSDDYDRMRRQRCVLRALAVEADTVRLLRGLPRLAEVFARRVRTDVSVDRLPELARLAARVDAPAMRTLAVRPPVHTDGRNENGFHSVTVAAVRADVDDVLHGDHPAAARRPLGDDQC